MTDGARNRGALAARNPDGTFAQGNSGRPHGTRTKATRAAEERLNGEAAGLTRVAKETALDGDPVAMRI